MSQQLIKWPGGKRQLLPEILRRLPATWRTYHEPFLGGASVLLELARSGRLRDGAVASDANKDLVGLYRTVQDYPDTLISTVRYLASDISEERYYEIRKWFNEDRDAPPYRRAAWFLYLNHLAFNGLYRVNGKGEFNASYCHPEKHGGGGSRKHTAAEIVREETIRECSGLLHGVRVDSRDFRAAVVDACAGDLVYLDPPYWPASPTASFTAYAGRFGPAEQRTLADACRELDRRGAFWLASNSDVPEVRELYRGFKIETVMARRSINRDASRRGPVAEVLISNYEPAAAMVPESAEKPTTRAEAVQIAMF